MPKPSAPSPARSLGVGRPPRLSTRLSRSLGSPGPSSARSTGVDRLKVISRDSFVPSPLSQTVLTDNTDIMEPKRPSWWKNVDQSRDITDVLEEKPVETNNIVDEFDVEILSQEKKTYRTMDLLESSGSESIGSIVVPQRKLFTQKENRHRMKYGDIINRRDSMAKANKTHIEDNLPSVGTKDLFGKGPVRSKPVFPSALLTVSPDKTIVNPKELAAEIVAPPRSLFGNRAGTKKKNMFADFIASESEDDIPDIQTRRFTFSKQPEALRRKSSASRGPNTSPLSSVATDTEMDDWKLLPSSTMMEQQLEDPTTPGRRVRLSKLIETRETVNTNSTASKTKLTDKSGTSKDKSKTSLNSLIAPKEGETEKSGKNSSSIEHNRNEPANNEEDIEVNKVDNLTHTVNKSSKHLSKSNIDDKVDENNKIDNLTRTINKQFSKSNIDEITEKHDVQVHKIDNLTRTLNKSTNKVLSKSNMDVLETELASIVGHEENDKDVQELDEANNEEMNLIYDECEHDTNQKQANNTPEAEPNIETNEGKALKEKMLVSETPMPRKTKSMMSKIVNETPEVIPEDDEPQETNELDEEAVFKPSQELERSTEIKTDDNNESRMQVEEPETVEKEIHNQEEDLKEKASDEDLESENEIEETDNQEKDSYRQDESQNGNVADSDNEEEEAMEVEEQKSDHESGQENEQSDGEFENENQIEDEEEPDEEEEESIRQEEEISQEEEEISQQEEEVSQEEEEISQEEEEINQEEDEEQNNESQEIENEVVDQSQEDEATNEQVDEDDLAPENIGSEILDSLNASHDTTGRNRVQNKTRSPEAILLGRANATDSFTGSSRRNTSIRKTLLKKSLSVRPSIAPPRESTGISDATKNSSAEGSGWDSHRNERKTLRLTFGKNFSPRKSLRTLVSEKSAKRQTIIDDANADLNLHQANSTELPEDFQEGEHVYEDDMETEPSQHEISQRTRQATLEQYLQKLKQDNMERKLKIQEKVRESLKVGPSKSDVLNSRVPTKLTLRRQALKTIQTAAPKRQNLKRTLDSLQLPPELVQDMNYKPPKRFRASNAPWITKRLYSFLENKLEPKYDYKARVRAEKLVETIYAFAREIRRQRVAPPHAVAELKREMARLDVVKTHYEFYMFFHEFMPREVKFKVVPDIVNDIPTPRNGVFSNIIEQEY